VSFNPQQLAKAIAHMVRISGSATSRTAAGIGDTWPQSLDDSKARRTGLEGAHRVEQMVTTSGQYRLSWTRRLSCKL